MRSTGFLEVHRAPVARIVDSHLSGSNTAVAWCPRSEALAPGAGFLEIHRRLMVGPVDSDLSGTTAVACLLRGIRLTTAWAGDCPALRITERFPLLCNLFCFCSASLDAACCLQQHTSKGRVQSASFLLNLLRAGDSRAVLARVDPGGSERTVAVPLTRDHEPCIAAEHRRIITAGGRVERCASPGRGMHISGWAAARAGDGATHARHACHQVASCWLMHRRFWDLHERLRPAQI